MTLERLHELGFGLDIVAAIDALTRRQGESYDAFIDRVLENPLATRIKNRDLRDNLDVSRLPGLGDEDLRRMSKYHRALMKLTAADS